MLFPSSVLFFIFCFCFFFRSKRVLSHSSSLLLLLSFNNPTCNEDVRLNCNRQYFLCLFWSKFCASSKGERFSPFWCLFPRDFSFFFFCFSDSTSLFSPMTRKEAKDRNESFFSFFQRALEQARVSLLFWEFLFFERRSDARDSLLWGGKRTRTRSRSREPSFGERWIRFIIHANWKCAKRTLSRFFSESFEKKEKGARSLEISARARALSRRTRRSARGKNGRNLSRTFTCTRSCAFYSREFFFLSSCVCFVCARLVLTTFFLLSRFQNEDIFRFSFCFLGAKLRKRGKWERKRRHEVRKERGYFFLFFGGKDLSVVLPKRTQTWIITFFVKVGGEGVQLAFAAFYFVQRR